MLVASDEQDQRDSRPAALRLFQRTCTRSGAGYALKRELTMAVCFSGIDAIQAGVAASMHLKHESSSLEHLQVLPGPSNLTQALERFFRQI